MRLNGRVMAGAAPGGFVVTADGGRYGILNRAPVSLAAARRTVFR